MRDNKRDDVIEVRHVTERKRTEVASDGAWRHGDVERVPAMEARV